MPGLCGFVVWGHDRPASKLQTVMDDLRHHPSHRALPEFQDENVAASLVLRRADAPGIHWKGPGGKQVWVDGEAWDENGPIPSDRLASELAAGHPRSHNGAFAAVIYDPRESSLCFVTDPYGIKFLYIRMALGFPSWSSELGNFARMPGIPPWIHVPCLRQLLDYGHPLGNATWFQGVNLLEPGTRLTYDLKNDRWTRMRTFDLEGQGPSPSPPFEQALAGLGESFRKAVARAARGHVGVALGGDLASRGVLAALPSPAPAVTWGQSGGSREDITRKSCAARGGALEFVSAGDESWWEAAKEAVRYTDGQAGVFHVHPPAFFAALERHMDICLTGSQGDGLLGGLYLEGRSFPFLTRYAQWGRRLRLQALHYSNTSTLFRFPLLDAPLLEKALALPRPWLRQARAFRALLLREFPDYFRAIPWERTGLPVTAAPWREGLQGLARDAGRRCGALLGRPRTEAARRLRQGPAAEFLRELLDPKKAVLARFFPYGEYRDCIQRHFRGADESEKLERYLTAEIWFRFLQGKGLLRPA